MWERNRERARARERERASERERETERERGISSSPYPVLDHLQMDTNLVIFRQEERECVFMIERDRMCECERERVCVRRCVREREPVCVLVPKRKRGRNLIIFLAPPRREREREQAREREGGGGARHLPTRFLINHRWIKTSSIPPTKKKSE